MWPAITPMPVVAGPSGPCTIMGFTVMRPVRWFALSPFVPRAGRWILVLSLLAYALLLWRHAGVHAGGSDSSGYFNQARLFLEGRLRAEPRPLPGLPMEAAPLYAYVPLGFVPRPSEPSLVPTYPTGLSLLLAGGVAVAGWEHGPTLVIVLHALAGLLVVYALGRAVELAPPLAALGALMLAVSPVYLMFALQAMSDVPALVWSGAAVLLGWHGARHGALALAAGVALGVAVLIRPTNAVLFAPVLLALGWSWRRWLWLGLGGLPAAAWFMYFNQRAYGHPLLTGYGGVDVLFAAEWGPAGLRHYAQWLPVVLSPLIVLGLGLPALLSRARRDVPVLGSWILVVLGVYAFYSYTHETWWYLRFVLPAFPALIVACLLVAGRLFTGRPSWVRRLAWVAAIALVTVNGRHWNRHWNVADTGQHESVYPRAAALVNTHVPPEAFVLAGQASGAIFFYTDRGIVRWDALDDRWPRVRAAAEKAGIPLHAVLFDFEVRPALLESVPGDWSKVFERAPVTFWRLDTER
jgi:hypothetical protein